jgi:hypothetical protein
MSTKRKTLELPKFVSCVCCTMPVDVADHEESTVCETCGHWICVQCAEDGRKHAQECKGMQ